MIDVLHKAQFTIGVDTGEVTPNVVMEMGYTGDHLNAEVSFRVYRVGGEYRLEIIDGNGAYDITEPLFSDQEGMVTYRIPSSWTAPGTATVRLIEYGENGRVAHYAPVSLFFADREEGELVEYCRPRFETLLETAEEAVESANAAADRVLAVDGMLRQAEERSKAADALATEASALSRQASALSKEANTLSVTAKAAAQQAAESSHDALVRAESVKGVYVGSGEMPEGYNIQIDPNGTAVPFEEMVLHKSALIYERDPCSGGIADTYAVTHIPIEEVLNRYYLFRIFRLWVGDVNVPSQEVTTMLLIVDPSTDANGELIGTATTHDRAGNRFLADFYHHTDGSFSINGVRYDKDGNSHTLGVYRVVGVI